MAEGPRRLSPASTDVALRSLEKLDRGNSKICDCQCASGTIGSRREFTLYELNQSMRRTAVGEQIKTASTPSVNALEAVAEESRNTTRELIGVGQTIKSEESNMNGLIYLIGLIVVIMAILSFFGLR